MMIDLHFWLSHKATDQYRTSQAYELSLPIWTASTHEFFSSASVIRVVHVHRNMKVLIVSTQEVPLLSG